jgi:PAS domain S-box-containing protein
MERVDAPPASAASAREAADGRLTDELLRLIIANLRDYAIFVLTPEGNIATWSPGARAIKGYEASEILGRHFSVFYPPEAIARHWPETELERARADGRFEDEGWRLRKDGSRFWANVVITALRDEHGELRGYAKVTRDLTERRQQEERLRQTEERFRLLVEGVRDYAIFMLDTEGRVATWNAGAEQLKGYVANEIIGRHFSTFYPAEAIRNNWPETELDGARRFGRFEDEGWRIRKDGTRFWANVVITALRDPTGELRGFAKVTRDLTNRLMVEKLEEQARRMNEFIAMLAHELRNPLAPIRNAGGLLTRFPDDAQRVAWAAGIIDRQTGQLTRLVDDLLDASRITSGKLTIDRTPIDLADVIARAVEATRPFIESRHHKLVLEVDAPTRVLGDVVRLTQVVSNLLHNAAKFTPPHGEIRVRLERGEDALIVVADNGEGFDQKLLTRAFDLFAQGNDDFARSRGGLGLGLAIVKRLTELHGGSVVARSAGPGQGAEVAVRLPLLRDFAASRPAVDGPRPVSEVPLSVLVVDDNVDSATTLRVLLELGGHRVATAYEGTEALRTVADLRPDVVLLDLGLPGLDGYEVARRIRIECLDRQPMLIATTGYGQEEDRRRTAAAGFDEHLVKPIDMQALERAMVEARLRKSRG